MPRDANGNYTLPSGNPVVTNTVIQSTWANDTMSDLANEMQDSLSRSGKGALTAPLGVVDKSGSVPGLNFQSEPTSGLKKEATGDVRVQVAGQDNIRFLSTGRATDVWNNDLTTPAFERVFTTPVANVLDANVEKTLQIKRETTPATPPGVTAAGELGVNIGDSPPTLYVGNGTTAVPFNDGQFVRFPSGTKMVFYQDTAPLGWTIDQTVDEHMVRLTKGSVALGVAGGTLGGTYNFSALFANLGEGSAPGIGNKAIDVSQMPAHNHGGATGLHTHGIQRQGSGASGNFIDYSSQPGAFPRGVPLYDAPNLQNVLTSDAASISSQGGGLGHSHTADLRGKWAACIVASKD